MMRCILALAGGLLAIGASANAQLINGGFNTGAFSPWLVAPTPMGNSFGTGVFNFDIDGPGPLPVSPAAQFIVGHTQPGGGWEGVQLLQQVLITPGMPYRLRADWACHALVNVYNASAGRFELVVNGVVVGSAQAPFLLPQMQAYGQVSGAFIASVGAVHLVGVRVTRNILLGEEVFQYLDNISLSECYADCNADGLLNISDFGCFLNKFALQQAYADCNGDALFNLSDFGCYQNKFALGCP